MSYLKLKEIKKLYFGYNEIARVLNISSDSAKVSAVRLTKKGIIARVKRGQYVLRDKLEIMDRKEKFIIANIIQTPSYISLMTALDYYEITTQMQKDFIESICVNRTKVIEVENNVFNYSKIKKELYFGFIKKEEFFIATPEKAFLDAFYLYSIKKYNFDLSSIDFDKLDKKLLKNLIKKYPYYMQKLYEHF